MASKPPSPSLVRLLDAARLATAALPPSRRIDDYDKLRADMGATSQAWHAWKERGLSKEGALLGAEQYGASAVWLLSGSLPRRWPSQTSPQQPLSAQAPDAPYTLAASDSVPSMVDAIAALSPLRYASVRAVLDQLPQHPELRDDAVTELRLLLAPSGKQAEAA